ncbi:recombinase family protein [Nocardioides zeae]
MLEEQAATPVAAAVPGRVRTLVGHARVSTADQSAELQVDALTAAGATRVFVEIASGKTDSRPELTRALDYLREGDVLVVWRLDRLGRSLRHLIDEVNALESRGIGFRSLTEAIDTTTAGGRLVFHVFGALGEFERELIVERTRAGPAAARARGRRGGRPRVMTPERITTARRLRDEDGLTLDQIAATIGVSRASVVRALSS